MRDPNFSESQLQQAVNSAIIRKIFELNGEWVFTNVPSLFDEFELGWDSAFFFPWLPQLPLENHEGCNYFIQYKLSQLLTTRGAKEWESWKGEYYRFKIPHCTKNKSTKKYEDDYHQWDALVKLAENGYPTYYATNSTLDKNEIINSSRLGSLLDFIPALDVRNIVNQHKFVTFTNNSSHFSMHSEIENIDKKNISDIFESDRQNSTLSESNRRLISQLRDMYEENELFIYDLNRISKEVSQINILPSEFIPFYKHRLLSGLIHKYIGAKLIWVPVKG